MIVLGVDICSIAVPDAASQFSRAFHSRARILVAVCIYHVSLTGRVAARSGSRKQLQEFQRGGRKQTATEEGEERLKSLADRVFQEPPPLS